MKSRNRDHRSQEQIEKYYRLKKELAAKLRNAGRDVRRHLCSEVYDELFQRIPHYPNLSHFRTPEHTLTTVRPQITAVAP